MPAKCDYICLSKEELDKLKADCVKSTKSKPKATKKKTTTKKKTASKPKARTVRKTPAKRVTTVKAVKKKTKTVNKNKNRNVNRNVNTNNNSVSVSVRATPKAVSNVYIIRPSQSAPRVEAPAKKRSSGSTYDAPFLPHRGYDGQPLPVVQSSRTRTVYVERSAPEPEIVIEPEQTVERSVTTASRKGRILSGIRSRRAARLNAGEVERLPAASSREYLPPAKEIALENCDDYSSDSEREACRKRNRRKVSN